MSETKGVTENHCWDCCCARSWKALEVTTYTGKSIVEHIEELKKERDELRGRVEELSSQLLLTALDLNPRTQELQCIHCSEVSLIVDGKWPETIKHTSTCIIPRLERERSGGRE